MKLACDDATTTDCVEADRKPVAKPELAFTVDESTALLELLYRVQLQGREAIGVAVLQQKLGRFLEENRKQ